MQDIDQFLEDMRKADSQNYKASLKGLLLAAVIEVWEKYPDLRLGQLLANSVPVNFYHRTDEELLHRICKTYQLDVAALAKSLGLEPEPEETKESKGIIQ